MRAWKHPKLEDVELTEIMHALSDPARMEIVRCIAKAGRPLTCGVLTAGRPKSSMSHHFRILRASGLIETTVAGKEHLNALRFTEVNTRFPGVLEAVLQQFDDEDGVKTPQCGMA